MRGGGARSRSRIAGSGGRTGLLPVATGRVADGAGPHIRQVSIKFRITAQQPIAGRLDTSTTGYTGYVDDDVVDGDTTGSPPVNRRLAAQDSGV